jgi:small membrane protein
MKSIQVILIFFSLLAAVLGSMAFRAKLICRLFAALLPCLALVLVILPDLTTDLARTLGVGRGTDLLFYATFFAAVHIFLLLYARTRRLERKLTESIRALAIQRAGGAGMQTANPALQEV